MAKVVGGLVHRGDATAKMSNGNPAGPKRSKANPAHSKGGTGRMMDPVKAAGKMLRRGK